MAAPVRVMVVDDSASTRTMLREALGMEGSIEVVGEAGSGREAVANAHRLRPDVVLMDVRMPDGDGVEATRTISAQLPGTKIVALTWSDDPGTVKEMLGAGAIGYVVKGGTIDELSSAIRHAHSGAPELDQRVLPAAMDELRRLLEEERERRQHVERLAEARSEFVQVLSHELRTPLTVISGALRMLQRAQISADEMSVLESAVRRAGELEFLVEGLELLGSTPEGEGQAYPEKAVRTASLRLGAGPDAANFAEERWDGVPHQFVERVVFELLANAVRHGQRPIAVHARRENGIAVFTVRDRGGWTPRSQEFTPFFQEDMSSTRTHGGFGLGLFVASRLCQACRGTLLVEAVGGVTIAGARFRLD
jgi:DNA-binding NarL/FixJ family response regulator